MKDRRTPVDDAIEDALIETYFDPGTSADVKDQIEQVLLDD